ncbi:hypothetical protein J6590_026442 [Homalodisca vitripennis]|nr:hypothetical protein J6590_026442 [Homalodisca vitripennis]
MFGRFAVYLKTKSLFYRPAESSPSPINRKREPGRLSVYTLCTLHIGMIDGRWATGIIEELVRPRVHNYDHDTQPSSALTAEICKVAGGGVASTRWLYEELVRPRVHNYDHDTQPSSALTAEICKMAGGGVASTRWLWEELVRPRVHNYDHDTEPSSALTAEICKEELVRPRVHNYDHDTQPSSALTAEICKVAGGGVASTRWLWEELVRPRWLVAESRPHVAECEPHVRTRTLTGAERGSLTNGTLLKHDDPEAVISDNEVFEESLSSQDALEMEVVFAQSKVQPNLHSPDRNAIVAGNHGKRDARPRYSDTKSLCLHIPYSALLRLSHNRCHPLSNCFRICRPARFPSQLVRLFLNYSTTNQRFSTVEMNDFQVAS